MGTSEGVLGSLCVERANAEQPVMIPAADAVTRELRTSC